MSLAWIDEFLKTGRFLTPGTSRPGWKGDRHQGPTKRSGGKGFGRRVRKYVPNAMNIERFAEKSARDARYQELKAKGTRNLFKGFDVDKWYVSFR